MDISDLFQAYQGMYLLGEKDEAVKELTRIGDHMRDEVSKDTSIYRQGRDMDVKEFQDRLDRMKQ